MNHSTDCSCGSDSVFSLMSSILRGEAGRLLTTDVTYAVTSLWDSAVPSWFLSGPLDRASATASVFPGAYSAIPLTHQPHQESLTPDRNIVHVLANEGHKRFVVLTSLKLSSP